MAGLGPCVQALRTVFSTGQHLLMRHESPGWPLAVSLASVPTVAVRACRPSREHPGPRAGSSRTCTGWPRVPGAAGALWALPNTITCPPLPPFVPTLRSGERAGTEAPRTHTARWAEPEPSMPASLPAGP